MASMALKARVRHPRNILILLQPFRQSQCITGMSLRTQTQSLQSQQQLLSRKRVQRRTQITQNLDSYANGKCDRTKGFPELEAVVSLSRLDELRESSGVLAPVEFSAVNHHAADGGAVAANPFGSAVHDDIGTVVDGAGKVTTSTECVVNLLISLNRTQGG